MTRAVLAALALLAASCAAPPTAPHPDAFAFAIMGDTPYNDREEVKFLEMVERTSAEPLAFVLHVGDLKGPGRCTDALFRHRRAQLDASRHPVVLTPGDNEWTDCRRRDMGSMDPIDALARLRRVYFADRWTLGQRRFETLAQDACLAPPVEGCGCAAHPENRAWTHGGVRFVTLNVPGSNNNEGFDAANDAEARCRNEANRRWLDGAAADASSPGIRALVVAIQANPWESRRPSAYYRFLEQMAAVASRVARPVVLVHGDSHTYRVDTPFANGVAITRVETYGSPMVGWVKVSVDPARPNLFSFEPRLVAFVPPI